jgi:ABC-type amino acid transport system permease subunit
MEVVQANPHGGWDAWAIWNLRAKYLAGPGETWRYAVSPLLALTHADYPLLTSGFIAHAWKAGGGQPTTTIPIAAALLFSGSALALLVASLALLRGPSLGLLAGMVALSNTAFLAHCVSQYADVPLGFYYLATLVAVSLGTGAESQRRSVLALAGFFASLAAWTKDEGILFAVVVLGCYVVVEWWAGGWRNLLRSFPWLLGGALPGLLAVAGFKLFLAPAANPMLTQRSADASVRVLTTQRWVTLIQAIFSEALDLGHGLLHPLVILPILVLALGFRFVPRHRRSVLLGALALATVFAGYGAVCVLNPSLLETRHDTPLERMYSQLWPSFVFLVFMVLRTLEEFALPVIQQVSNTPARRRKQKRSRWAAASEPRSLVREGSPGVPADAGGRRGALDAVPGFTNW